MHMLLRYREVLQRDHRDITYVLYHVRYRTGYHHQEVDMIQLAPDNGRLFMYDYYSKPRIGWSREGTTQDRDVTWRGEDDLVDEEYSVLPELFRSVAVGLV